MIHNIKNKSYHNIIKLCVNLCNFVVIVLYDHDIHIHCPFPGYPERKYLQK